MNLAQKFNLIKYSITRSLLITVPQLQTPLLDFKLSLENFTEFDLL